MNLLDEKLSTLKNNFVDEYTFLFNVDKKQALHYIKTNERFVYLTDLWYERLNNDDLNGAYQVYDDDYYFTDLWNCFATYSRRYLKNIKKTDLYNSIKDSKVVVDLGCGVGLTTSILTQLFPNATVYGTNLKNTKQWKFCEQMSQIYNFKMIETIYEIEGKVDIVFASEYFEHILSPISHLNEIITKISPKYFIIANAFNTRSIGHFEKYIDGNQEIISRKFNKFLKSAKYTKVKTGLFNNKPNVWIRND